MCPRWVDKEVVVERKAGPHDKVCGEFVSGEAALYLHDLDRKLKYLSETDSLVSQDSRDFWNGDHLFAFWFHPEIWG